MEDNFARKGAWMGSSDAEWVRRSLAGDEAAFEALYAAHAGRVKAYFLRSGFGDAGADDGAQETFARAFRSLVTFRAERGGFGTWLGAIARNVARHRWRQRREPESFETALAEQMFASADNPGALAAAREETAAVRECVAALPADLGRIVHLRYVEGRTTRGIAAAVNTPEATVRLHLQQAREKIRQCLEARGVLE